MINKDALRETVVFKDERGKVVKKGDIVLVRCHFPFSSCFMYGGVDKIRIRKDGYFEVTLKGEKGWYVNPLKLAK